MYYFHKTNIILLLIFLLTGCSPPIEGVSREGLTIADIKIDFKGATDKDQKIITNVCKGFLMSKSQVRDFFVHSAFVKDTSPDNRYGILPCYASGTALINGHSFKWLIRSGGVGEFAGEKHRFIKICGKECCNKVSYIC